MPTQRPSKSVRMSGKIRMLPAEKEGLGEPYYGRCGIHYDELPELHQRKTGISRKVLLHVIPEYGNITDFCTDLTPCPLEYTGALVVVDQDEAYNKRLVPSTIQPLVVARKLVPQGVRYNRYENDAFFQLIVDTHHFHPSDTIVGREPSEFGEVGYEHGDRLAVVLPKDSRRLVVFAKKTVPSREQKWVKLNLTEYNDSDRFTRYAGWPGI